MLGYLFLLIFLIIIAVIAYWYLKMPKNLPPGPPGFPYIGCAPFMKIGEEHLILEEWMERFGKIFRFYMGNQLIIGLADFELIEEALVNQGDDFNGRPKPPPFAPSKIPPGCGILSSEGALWEERRNFLFKLCHELVEKNLVEMKIKEATEDLIQIINTKKIHSFDVQSILNVAVSNVMCSIIFGQRYDERGVDFSEQIETLTQKIAQTQINFLSPINFFPILLEIPVIKKRIQKLMNEGDEIGEFFECLIKDTRITFNPSEEPTNYIHSFLRAKAHKSGKYFDEKQLLVSVFNLFTAGTETVSATLKWAIFFMAKYPEVQKQVVREMFSRIGSNKLSVGTDELPEWADRDSLPYTQATIMEIQRMANVVPLSIAHRTLKPTKLARYDIPADTLIVPLLWTVFKDPQHFPNPEEFDPKRFLDDDGKLVHHPAFIPFSTGKRSCLGEPLAKMELFLFFTSLIGKFKFFFPRDKPNPPIKRTVSMVINPVPFLVCAKMRRPEDPNLD